MSAQHTPGPYAVDRFGDRLEIIQEETTATLATLRGGAENSRVIATANLFAASEELLCASEEALTALENYQTPSAIAAVMRLRAAIAKATGSAA